MPIIQDCIARIKSNIAGMSVADGYNFGWGSVQEYDLNRMEFPAAVVRLSDREVNEDNPNGVHAQAYHNRVPVFIQVYLWKDEYGNYPEDEIKIEYFKALDDLKRVFGIDFFLGGSCTKIMYKQFRFIKSDSGDGHIPITMLTNWDVYYIQDRLNPETIAG